VSRALWCALFALLAFAANSVLCRMALRVPHIDPASFTDIRIVSGAVTLWLLARLTSLGRRARGGSWLSALALLAYAVAFSFAYVRLTAGTGALLLFGAVQVAMIGAGFLGGERIDRIIAVGWLVAIAGLVLLLLPGISAPAPREAAFMIFAGIAWGIYSLHGRGSTNPLADTAGNFARAVPGALLVSALFFAHRAADPPGVLLAVLSGALASGIGYAAWYTALPRLGAIAAANAQLSVPVLAALAGVMLFGEAITVRLALASVLVLGGTALAVRRGLRLRTAHPAAATNSR
jgi:drug/metabolite transporter (DMT)-like permease